MARTYLPFLKTAVATLWGSLQIVSRDAFGKIDQGTVDGILQRWQASIFRAGNCTVEGFGMEHLDAACPYVVMSNHQSLLDVPSLYATFPGRLRMISKKELGRVPVWGSAMRAAGVVFVDRGARGKAIAALDSAKALLSQGTSMWLAPEGTRSADGSLLPFKKGGFHLARQLGAAIVPVWIEGTRKIIEKNTFAVTPGGHVVVRYGVPIPTAGVDEAGLPALMEHVREAMLLLAEAARQGPPHTQVGAKSP